MVVMSEISGGRRRRCDARCYNGKPTSRCKCICGGHNHAVGEKRAIENIRDLFLRKEEGVHEAQEQAAGNVGVGCHL